jgi:DNA-binding CsgD family transcriptional regulator
MRALADLADVCARSGSAHEILAALRATLDTDVIGIWLWDAEHGSARALAPERQAPVRDASGLFAQAHGGAEVVLARPEEVAREPLLAGLVPAARHVVLVPVRAHRGGSVIVGLSAQDSHQAARAPVLVAATLAGLAIARLEARAVEVSPTQPELEHEVALLTPREREVLLLIAEGHGNAHIARTLGLTLGTVKLHVRHVLRKLGVDSRTQAALRIVELGLRR